ncbi:MAG TPA: GNAT family N-acetyltransferase [Bordetella sp.]|jgi:ribosomal protein S18 acetylase RimI-like enzyme|nr:GNAT family N-acetyltransferase [Bordetella sp.]
MHDLAVDKVAVRMEEAALNATVVREQMLYDGWLVRWAPAKAKRARSINVIASPHRDLTEKLEFCQALYARAKLPLIFRLTSTGPDFELDGQLDSRGFRRFDETCVMAVSMRTSRPASAQATLRYEEADAGRFADITGQLRAYASEHIVEHQHRLAGIAVPSIKLSACDETGRYVAAGMAVVDGDVAGIFDVVVDEHVRRRGYARQMMGKLMDAAFDAGARTAYLQVEYSNTAARQLYASLDFSDRYTYWYRTHQHE